MNRRMAKVIMTLDDIDSQSKALGVKIGSYQGYTDGNVSSGTALVSPYVTIPEGGKAGQSGCKYTAIVAPGAANPNSTFVSLNYKGDWYNQWGRCNGIAIGRLLCERACYRECYRYGLG